MRIFKDDSTRDKWYVDYFFRGRRIRYFAGTSKAAAGTLRTRIEMEINQGVHDPAKLRDELNGRAGSGMTLGQLTDLFLKLYRSRGLSGYYGQRVKTYLKYFGESTPISEIGPLQVEAFRNWCSENGFGPASVRKNLISLGTIYRWAIAKGIVTENPADPIKVKRPGEPPNRTVFLSQEQVRQLLEECEPDLRRLVHFYVETGMSLGDALKLRWVDMDTKTGWIYAKRGKVGNRPYKIPYTDLLEAIVGSRPRHIRSELVFCNSDGQKLKGNKISKAIKAAMKRIGMPEASAHSLRHTFASRLVARGVHTKMIAELLGQSEATVTARYTHLTGERIQQTMRQIHDQEEAADEKEESEPHRIPRGS